MLRYYSDLRQQPPPDKSSGIQQPSTAQHAQGSLNKIEKNFKQELRRVKEHLSGDQNTFCFKS